MDSKNDKREEPTKTPHLPRGKALIKAASKLGFEIELPPRSQDETRPVFEDDVSSLNPFTAPAP